MELLKRILFVAGVALIFVVLALRSDAATLTTVTGKIQTPSGSALTASTYVLFDLEYCGQNQPRIAGTAQLPALELKLTLNRGIDSSGNISTSLYGNDQITCGVTLGGTRWRVTYVVAGNPGPVCDYNITGASWDLNTQICSTVAPVVTPPSGDTTYGRIDTGNMPFTGPISACRVNGRYEVGSTCYPTVQSAITAATSTGGTIYVPYSVSGYTIDTITVPSNVNISCDTKAFNLNVPAGKAGFLVNGGAHGRIDSCNFNLLGATGAAIVANDTSGGGPGSLDNDLSGLRFTQTFTSFPDATHVVVVPISSWTRTANVATVNCNSPCGVAQGAVVMIDAAAAGSTTTLNGWWQVSTASTNSFTFISEAANDTGSSGGVVLQTQLGLVVLNQSQAHGGADYYTDVHSPQCQYLDICVMTWSPANGGGANAWNFYGVRTIGSRLGMWFSGFSEEHNVFGLFAGASGYTGIVVPVSAASRSGSTTATAICSSACGVLPGEGFIATGFTSSDYNGTWNVAQVLSATSFTYVVKNSATDSASVIGTLKTDLYGFECGDHYGGDCSLNTIHGVKVDNGANGSGYILRSGAAFNVIESPAGGHANIDKSSPGTNVYINNAAGEISAGVIQAVLSLTTSNGLAVSGGTNSIDIGSTSGVFHGHVWCDAVSNKQTCDYMTNVSTHDGTTYAVDNALYGSWVLEVQASATDSLSNYTMYYRVAGAGDGKGSVIGSWTNTGKLTASSGVAPSSTADAITWFKKATHASLDLASVATAACTAEQTETITGAALGDDCRVSAGTALEAGGFFRCAVTATDTAKWQLCNLSGGAIDRASDTYTIRVTR